MGRFLLRSLIANGMVSLSEPAAPPPPQRRRLLLERLEDRLLFDAGPAAPIDADAELADAQASQEALSQAASLAEPADVRVFGSLDQVEAVVADLSGASSVSEFLPGAETPVAVDGSTTSVLTAEPTGTSLDSDELAEQLLTTADELRSERHEATSGVREELLTGQPVSRSEVVTRREIAFVDTSLVGHEQLVTDLLAQHDPSREMQIVLVDARDNGLAKITDTLRQASDIDAIHILSHGDSRGFRLGSQWVTSDLLAGFSAEVTSWGDALLDGADILIYGCDLASATAGRELLQSLAALTGADVAASDDVTGSSAQGGDWDLEFRIGDVSTASALSDGGAFEGTLVTVNVGNGALVGALGRGLYSIDVTTAKATLLATAPATIGGVAVSSTINSVASNPIDGLIYFVDNESATANEELFAYDFINNTFLLLDDNLTDNGVVVGSRGVGSGSGYYSTTNQTLYLGVERSTSTTDVLFAITFTAGSNGRTVDGVTVEQTVTLSGAFSSHDWGDILVDVANNRWIDLDSGSTTSRTFNLATDALISATNHGFSGTQGGTDHNGNSYIVSSSLRTYDPDTNTLGSSSVTITTNGSTGWGSAADAAGLVPKTAQVGNLIFKDQNADGTFNGTDSGIGNVTVTIHDDVDGDGVIDAVDRLLGTDTSAANGSYEFAGLLPGQYIITITDANGVLTGASSTTSGGLTQTVSINLIGQSILTTDFGFDLNDVPTTADSSVTTNEDTSRTFAASDFPFSDADGDTLQSVTISSLPAEGLLKLNGTNVTAGQVIPVANINAGQLVFTPDSNESNTPYTTFTFSVSDGSLSSSAATMTVHVTPVNDAPAGTNGSRTIDEDATYLFAASDFGFSDPVDSPAHTFLEVVINTLPASGTLRLSGTPLTGGQVIPVGQIGNLTYSPPAQAFGSPLTSFTFSVRDNGGTANGGQNTDLSPNTFTFHVNPQNDPPVADDETFTVPEDGSVVIDVLNGDTDVDGDTLTVTEIDGSPISVGNPVTIATGVVSLNGDGTLTFAPNENFNGAAAFDYTVSDGNGGTDVGHVSGNLTPVNDAPVGGDNSRTTLEDTDYVFAVVDFPFSDVDSDPLAEVRIDSLPTNGTLLLDGVAVSTSDIIAVADITSGNLIFRPDATENGSPYATFDFSVSDGTDFVASPSTMTMHVTPVGFPPVADDETFVVPEDGSVIIDVLDGDTDIDGDSLAVTEIDGSPISLGNPVTTATGVVSLNVDGTLTFTPNADFNGPAAFDYTVSDGLATDVGNVSGDVTPVDDLPSGGDYSVTTPEETDYVFATSEFPYSDVDGDALTRVRIDSLPTDGTLLLYGNPIGAGDLIPLVDIAVGGLSFRPDADESGSPYTTFAFSVGNATAFVATPSTMTVHVTPTTVSVVKSLFDSSDPSTIGSNVTIGEELCFALLVTLSEGNSTDLIVTDMLPDGLQYGSWTLLSEAASSNGLLTADFNGSVPAPSVAGGASDGEDVSFTFGAISVASDGDAANNSFVLLVHAFVSDIPSNHDPLASTPVLSNTATADVSNALPPSPSNSVDVTVVEPDLSVTISNGVATLTAGQTTSYSITITNDGDLSATGVTLSGSLPVDRIAFVSSDDAANFSVDGSGSFVWTPAISSLAPGDSLTLLLAAQVGSSLASGITEVTIPVSVTHNNIEPTPANNSAEDNDTLDAAPDLRLSKTDYTDSVSPGPCSSYTINVGNFGSQEATNVVVTETIPDGSTFNPALSDTGWTSVGGNVYEYSIASLPAGASFNINLSVFIDSPAIAGREVIINTVTIADDGMNGPDLDPTDNTATDTDTLDALPMYDIGIDDLQLSAVPGESLTYYVNFNNYGLQNGTGVVITVSYPTALLTNIVASDGGIVDTLAGTITWNVGDLAANDPRTFEIAADVREVIPAGTDDVTLTAAITDDGTNGPDPDLSDNSSSDTDTLVAQPDYQITIDDGETTVRPGDPLTYTIGVANQGQQDGTGVVVSVSFPTSLLENVVASHGGVVDALAGTITWNLGDLDAGDSATLTVTTQVRNAISTQASSLTLTATITDDGLNGADPTPLNNLDDDLDRLQVYAYDSFHDWKDLRSAFLAPQRFVVGRPLAPLPVDPVFSGLTEPGSTLVARIYDADGRQLGDRQVVADTGGNWLVTFPNIVIYEQPHRMEIIVTPAINNAVHENGFNLRRYFHPAVHSGLVMTESLSVAGVFRNRAYNIIEAQHSANTHPLGFHWFSHAYELNAASTNVAQM